MKAIAFSGNSNSGKTTLIQKLSLLLPPTKRVCIVKHDPKNKASIDTEGNNMFEKNKVVFNERKDAVYEKISKQVGFIK